VCQPHQISLRVKPDELSDALLFYAGENSLGTGDYMGVVIEDQRIAVKYDSGAFSFVIDMFQSDPYARPFK
jgi:hypothetical protein